MTPSELAAAVATLVGALGGSMVGAVFVVRAIKALMRAGGGE